MVVEECRNESWSSLAEGIRTCIACAQNDVSERKTDILFNTLALKKEWPSRDKILNAHWDCSQCTACRLHQTRTNSVYGSGSENARVLVIGEAPGVDEDELGIPFCGKTGTLLRDFMKKIGFNLLHDVYFTNAVACIPRDTKNSSFRAPTPAELQACQPRFNSVVTNLNKLQVVLLLGKQAYVAWKCRHKPELIAETTRKTKMIDVIGWDGSEKDIPVYTTYHPSYIERQGRPKELTQSWVNDLKQVYKFIHIKGDNKDA